MNETNPEVFAVAAANLVISTLTDDELVTANLCAALGNDPRKTLCWPNARPLFTSVGPNGEPAMHSLVRNAVSQAVLKRIKMEEP